MAIPKYQGNIKPFDAGPDDIVDATEAEASLNAPAPSPNGLAAPTGKRIDIIRPDGSAGSIDEADLPRAVTLGYKVETPEQTAVREYVARNKGIGADVDTALRRFADQATFGAAEPIFESMESASSDPLFRAKQEALLNAHKTAGYVGSGLGFGTSLLYGGPLFDSAAGAGKATKGAILGARALEDVGGESVGNTLASMVPEGAVAAARKAGPGFARQLVASGAGHAVEGAVLMAPKALTEASLGDPEQAAETLLFGAGAGALIGLVGPAASKIKSGYDTAAEVVGAKAATEGEGGIVGGLKGYADKQTIKSFNPLKRWSKKIDGIGESEVATVAKKYNLMPTFGQTAEDVAENVATMKASVGEKIGSIVESTSGKAPRVSASEVANIIEKKAESFEAGAQSLGAAPIRKKLRELADNAVKGFPDELSLSDLDEVRQYIGDNIPDSEKSKGMRKAIGSLYHELNDLFFQKAESAIDGIGGDAAKVLDELRTLKRDYRALVPLSEATKDNIARGISNRSHSLTDYLGNIIGGTVGHAFGPAGSVAGAFVGGQINKIGRAYGNTYLSKGADALAEMFGGAAARNPLDVGGLLGVEQAMKHTAERIDEIPSILGGALRGSAIDTLPEHAATAFISSFQKGSTSSAQKVEQYKTLADELTSLTADPIRMQTKLREIVEPYSKDAPTVSAQYAAKSAAAMQYLADTMPKDRHAPNPFAPRDWKPTDTDLAQWARRWQTTLDPFSAVTRVVDGTLTKADVETLQRLYPKIYQRMQQSVVDYGMSPEIKSMPYAQRLKLSMLMQTPIDPSMRDVAGLQSMFASPAPPSGDGKKPSTSKSAGPKIKLNPDALGASTGIQKIASK